MPLERIPQGLIDTTSIKGPFSKYLNWRETELLIALVRSVQPRVMIEFGTNLGITAKRVLENVPTLERYIGIDVPFDHVPPLANQRDEVPMSAGCFAADDPRFWLMLADPALTPDALEPCDAAFIDGDHSEAGVAADTNI